MIVTLRRLFDTKKRKKMKNQFKWFTLSLLIAMIFGTRAQAAETANSGLENGGDVTLLSTKVYTLVVEDYGEFYFDGKTLTKALPAHVSFFIKDSNGIEYHAADEYKNIIRAENHKKLNTSKEGENFYISKANTWIFEINEAEDGSVKLTVRPKKKGETKYMISLSREEESEDVFVDNKLTKEMTTTPFFIIRSDDYGIAEMTAVNRNNKEGYFIWEFSEENNTTNFIPGERRCMYRMAKKGTYTFTLDLKNNAVTAELSDGKEYTLVTNDGNEYAFDKFTLTQAIPAQTEFYIKDNNGKKYYAGNTILDAVIITAENHENLPTFDSGKNFYIIKANTWVFTLNETADNGMTLTIAPQTESETKYMITEKLNEESEYVFVDNKLTKEMTTEAFFIVRSDDYGIFELTAAERNVKKGNNAYYIWEFSEDNNSVRYIAGERRNMYCVGKPGLYTFILDHEQKTVSFIPLSNTANNDTSTAISTVFSDDNWSVDENGEWYTIDGRLCNCKPMQKGLYIHNGHKVAIK